MEDVDMSSANPVLEENSILNHLRYLREHFPRTQLVLFIENNIHRTYVNGLKTKLYSSDVGRVLHIVTSEDEREPQTGVRTEEETKKNAARHFAELLMLDKVVLWSEFFTNQFTMGPNGERVNPIGVLNQQLCNLERLPKKKDMITDDPDYVISGKRGGKKDDISISTLLLALWLACFCSDPQIVRLYPNMVVSMEHPFITVIRIMNGIRRPFLRIVDRGHH